MNINLIATPSPRQTDGVSSAPGIPADQRQHLVEAEARLGALKAEIRAAVGPLLDQMERARALVRLFYLSQSVVIDPEVVRLRRKVGYLKHELKNLHAANAHRNALVRLVRALMCKERFADLSKQAEALAVRARRAEKPVVRP